jgi:hypothetical protein
MEKPIDVRLSALSNATLIGMRNLAKEVTVAFAKSGSVTDYKDVPLLYKAMLLVQLEEHEGSGGS